MCIALFLFVPMLHVQVLQCLSGLGLTSSGGSGQVTMELHEQLQKRGLLTWTDKYLTVLVLPWCSIISLKHCFPMRCYQIHVFQCVIWRDLSKAVLLVRSRFRVAQVTETHGCRNSVARIQIFPEAFWVFFLTAHTQKEWILMLEPGSEYHNNSY